VQTTGSLQRIMREDLDEVRFCHGGDLLCLGQSAGDADVDAQVIDQLLLDIHRVHLRSPLFIPLTA